MTGVNLVPDFILELFLPFLFPQAMRTSEDRSGPLVTCKGNPCQSTGSSSPVSTGNLPVLPLQVTNDPDQSFEVLIGYRGICLYNSGLFWTLVFVINLLFNFTLFLLRSSIVGFWASMATESPLNLYANIDKCSAYL